MRNHCLLQVGNRPVWRTVKNGSRTYISSLTKSVKDIRLNSGIKSIKRHQEKVILTNVNGETSEFDHVIFATHPDQALKILGSEATLDEIKILGAIKYSKNQAILHRDKNQMPIEHKVWSSWNYLTSADKETESSKVTVTYHMNRLQSFVDANKFGDVFVTLNPLTAPNPDLVMRVFDYEHPIYNLQVITY